ncbi:MAG: hypothetical protein IKJ74_03930, partial [Clostridia bacterium]|nr:hypothetical protein [Clostridia bacterium]
FFAVMDEFLLYCIRFAKAATVLGYSKTNQTIKMLRTFGTEHFLYANLITMIYEYISIFFSAKFLRFLLFKEGTSFFAESEKMTRVSFSMSFRPPEPDCAEPNGDGRVTVPRCHLLFQKKKRPCGKHTPCKSKEKEPH